MNNVIEIFIFTKTNKIRMANKEESPIEAVIKATNFAAIKHRNQRRKDEAKTPYINHPIGVAFILIEEGNITDSAVIQVSISCIESKL